MPRTKKIVDLSHALTSNTPVYPGDPIPLFTVATTIEHEGYSLFNVRLGSQTGSHVDAPYHFRNGGATVDKGDLVNFMGHGLIVDVTYKAAREEVNLEDLRKHEPQIATTDMVLFKTNWYKKAGTPEFYDHPYLAQAAGIYLLDMGVKVAGIDAINLDRSGGAQFPIHDMFSDAGRVIAENLAHLDPVDFESPVFVFLPLKLIGCDGSPVRAVAVEFE